MADNLPNGFNSALAADDLGSGVKIPRVKVTFGADGSAGDVSGSNPLPVAPQGTDYEKVAASQTDQVLGATGAIGDLLAGVLIIPATTSPGAVSIKDGSGNAITVFSGGANSVSSLIPFMVPLGIKCLGASWKVTTGTNVSVVAVGDFT